MMIVGPAHRWIDAMSPPSAHRALIFVSPGQTPDDRVARLAKNTLIVVNDITAPQADLVAPDAEMMRRVLSIKAGYEPDLYVGCFAGVSRSPAAAYAIVCRHTEPGREVELAETLRRVCPSATPNPLMVSLADRLLAREGRMVAAIAAIGRGADAFEGEVFAWDLATGSAQTLSRGA